MRRVAGLTALALAGCASASGGASLGADEAALRALDAAYVAAWSQDDPAAQEADVLALFAADGAILPGGGFPQAAGHDALSAFWFPEGAPPTVITRFTHDVIDVDVLGDAGVLRGRFELRFAYDGADYAQEGNYLLVAERGEAGAWRIAHLAWSDHVLD